ncbi:hypothetical protein M408DRAFT_28437 [Serendipita vermifera MAFF 305830]|uniref:Fatty acid desaturase domain-containing protein n=1 Tax=Serendipita vermifera MAFF 305830 TaxID=933852 RepID=A0A0C3ADS2_SERVB|nr:hypothetical protein M408DRAFT_28437 [Serendipita vermifera MAFF 305830]
MIRFVGSVRLCRLSSRYQDLGYRIRLRPPSTLRIRIHQQCDVLDPEFLVNRESSPLTSIELVPQFCTNGLGVPYHSWGISHVYHHASTEHMSPKARSELNLPSFDPTTDDPLGLNAPNEVMGGILECIDDSKISAASYGVLQLLFGRLMYLIRNATGQRSYPRFTNHFQPSSVIFSPQQSGDIILSDVGVLLWIGGLVYGSMEFGFGTMMRVYGFPFLWWRGPAFNFQRCALSTLDRQILGGAGPVFAWLGGYLTHGISETHLLHHVCSKIPHYHAWEAADALRARLASSGIVLKGAPASLTEVYKTIRSCKFVEDEGDVVFYTNAYGKAACKAMYNEPVSDSGINVVDL